MDIYACVKMSRSLGIELLPSPYYMQNPCNNLHCVISWCQLCKILYFSLLMVGSSHPLLFPGIPVMLHAPSSGYVELCCCQFLFLSLFCKSLPHHLHKIFMFPILEFCSMVNFSLNLSLSSSINFILHWVLTSLLHA